MEKEIEGGEGEGEYRTEGEERKEVAADNGGQAGKGQGKAEEYLVEER